MGAEIPLWVGGLQKLVTGVTKQTTCEDIVKAVVSYSERSKSRRDYKEYSIIERWRKVERPLENKSRILKVWKTWGVEQRNVKFVLKKTRGHIPKDAKTHRKKHSCRIHKVHATCPRLKTKDKLEDDESQDKNVDIPKEIEKLKKVVISQNEILDAQEKKLEEKDREIELFETQIHLLRVQEIGSNYVQDTYLGESAETGFSTSDHKLDEEDISTSLPEVIEITQKVLDITEKIIKEEKNIKYLSKLVRQCQSTKESLQRKIKKTDEVVEKLRKFNEEQLSDICENENSLLNCQRILDEKQCQVRCLQLDYENEHQQNLRLEEKCSVLKKSFSKSEFNERLVNDSNSDTGLSSLHSSDDGRTALDTLV